MAIDAAVAQPRLGRRHGSVGHFRRLTPRELADGELALLGPGQIERPAGGLLLRGQIKKTRQLAARFGRAGGHKLRNRQQFQPRLILIQRSVGQNAIGCAEVDANDVLGRHNSILVSYNSTSAGAMIRTAAALPDHEGNSHAVASQPG